MSMQPEGQGWDEQGSWCGGGGGGGQFPGRPPWWWLYPPPWGPGGKPPGPGGGTGGGTTGPIVGVTDGSAAQAGMVGEYLRGGQTVTLANTAAPGHIVRTVTPLVVPAGDWDLAAFGIFALEAEAFQFYLTPLPAGMADDLNAALVVGGGVLDWGARLVSPRVQGRFSTPTLMAFSVDVVNQTVNPSIANPYFQVFATARRMR